MDPLSDNDAAAIILEAIRTAPSAAVGVEILSGIIHATTEQERAAVLVFLEQHLPPQLFAIVGGYIREGAHRKDA